jgi:23S rRNA pseudouridine1911/1915/1917 synthase
MAISNKGKMAITKWKILDMYPPLATLIECKLETGRTHQIRVHFSDLGHSIIGDPLYGKPLSQKRMVDKIHKHKIASASLFERQALHATKLSFIHPITKQYLEFISPLPNDIKHLIEVLKN